MARESQRMQVGLIICIMAIVILLTTTFFSWRAYNESGQQLAAKQQELSRAQQDLRTQVSSNQYLQAMIGAGSTTMEALESGGLALSDELKTTKTQFEQDMKQFAEGLPAAERNYRGVANSLISEIQALNQQLADANDRINQVLAERNQKVEELTQRAQTAEEGHQKAAADLEAEKQAFAADRAKHISQSQTDAQKIEELSQKMTEVESAAKKQDQSQSQKIGELENRIVLLNEKFANIHKESFEQPHGRIVSINQTERTVWVNLGAADGLRPQVSFSVYEEGTTGVQQAEPKARLEVTRVFDQHLSEARIVEDELSNPILRGDVVYSPAWRPAMKVRFALAGFMDINNDGQSDRELIRNVITMNGGVIDAELLDDGEMTGKLDVGTRFLVLGDRPTEREKADAVKAFSMLIDDAQRYGVETLKVGDLLNLMGWKPELRTVDLGGSSGALRNEEGEEAFRPRRPPSGPMTPAPTPPTEPAPRGEDDSAFE